ncbi:hypothetical protein AN960_13940 [Bacillus sp. FJAT-25509]|nr:hypothetical protein AN960_13940 [Bacillus sp. FJAT-25509]
MSSSHRPIWSMTLHFYERNEKFMKKRLLFYIKKGLIIEGLKKNSNKGMGKRKIKSKIWEALDE